MAATEGKSKDQRGMKQHYVGRPLETEGNK